MTWHCSLPTDMEGTARLVTCRSYRVAAASSCPRAASASATSARMAAALRWRPQRL